LPKTRLGKANAANQKGHAGGKPVGGTKASCPLKDYKLVKLTVIQNATQNNVTGAKNWAAVKKTTDHVIIEATTSPNTEEAWKKIKWSGDAGTLVKGKLNQRRLSRNASKKYHVEAELGGVKDDVNVWVLWAKVTIDSNPNHVTPPNSVQFGTLHDGTEKLGARYYKGGNWAAGKIAAIAKITPVGVYDVVKSGWKFRRERTTHDWGDGWKVDPGDGAKYYYWTTTWVDDTSYDSFTKLIPDNDDQIYDIDGPTVPYRINDYETYNNFRQWIEWNKEKCSDYGLWYFNGRWKKGHGPSEITMVEVGNGNKKLPKKSFFHPEKDPG